MSTKATGNKKHLTLADRAAIEHGISRGENFTQIACRILLPFPRRFGVTFSGFLIFKTKPSGSAQNASIFRTV